MSDSDQSGEATATPSALPSWAPAQAQVLLSLLNDLIEAVDEGRPADRCLSGFFAKQKKFGSRDRRFLRDACFSWLRWRGLLLDEPLPFGICAAWALDGHRIWPPALASLLQDLGKEAPQELSEDPLSRIPEVSAALGLNLPGPEQLLPDGWEEEFSHTGPFEDRLREHVLRPPTWMRVDQQAQPELHAQLIEAGAEWAGESAACAYALRKAGTVRLLLQQHSAHVELQDLASQQVARICAPKSGEFWWDACCGAGGKSLQLLDLAERNLDLTCTDKRESVLTELSKRGRRHGLAKTRRYALDLLRDPTMPNIEFDGILVDAPCSGSGTWARNPDGPWRSDPGNLRQLGRRQLKMLHAVLPALKEGGSLIYAVCSLTKSETIQVTQAFLAEAKVELESFPHPLTGQEQAGELFLLPGELNADGMYIARFRKTS